jgi:hypothetical protein
MTVDRKLNLAAGEVRRFSETVVIPTLDSPRRRAILSTGKPPKSVVRPAGIAAATAVLVLVIVGAAALLRGNEPPEVADTPPTVPSVVVPPETTASPTPETTVPLEEAEPVPPIMWEIVPAQESLGATDPTHDYLLHTVVAGGPGLIGAGEVRPAGSEFNGGLPVSGGVAAVWTSADGYSWDRVEHDETVFGAPGGALITDLVAAGPGFVAVGGVGEESGAAVWVSNTGTDWERVTSPGFDDTMMYAVAAGDPGLVAVGNGAIWFSIDGIQWGRVEGLDEIGLLADVAYADWGFVAVGWRDGFGVCGSGEGGETVTPFAWVSTIGTDWTEVALHPRTGDEWLVMYARTVAAHGADVVIAGSSAATCPSHFDASPAFWTSNDGSDWAEHILDPAYVSGMLRPEAYVPGLAVTDQGLIATGAWIHTVKSENDTPKSRPAAWHSTDGGATWDEAPTGAPFETVTGLPDSVIDDVVALGERLVAVGTHEGAATVWIAEWADSTTEE